jgi:HlyD family secretion protein
MVRPTEPSTRRRGRLSAFLISGVIAALLAACSGAGGAPAQNEIRSAPIERGSIEVTVSATGDVAPEAQASLTFDLTGIIGSVHVGVGDKVRTGDVLMEIDPVSLGATAAQNQADLIDAQKALKDLLTPPTALQLAQAEQDVLDAEQAVKDAQRHLDGVEHPDVADYQQTLDDALTTLDNAQYEATLTSIGAETGAVNAAQDALNRANDALGAAQIADNGCGGCDPDRLQHAEDNYNGAANALESAQLQLQMAESSHQQAIRDAQDAVDEAQRHLDAAQAGPLLSDVALAQAQLTTAQATYEQRKTDLADLKDGPDDDEVAAAQARVAAAEARLAETKLVAPFAGTVAAVNFSPGDTVAAGAPAVVLADLSGLHINTRVDELDIAQVKAGQSVQITLDALPGASLSGTVGIINLSPDPLQDTIEYPVRVELNNTDQPVRIGMTAALDILVASKSDVLLVPNWALQYDREQSSTYVNVERNGTTVTVPVELGLRNESVSEVLSGLEAGDQVTVLVTPEPGGGPFGGGG